MFAAGAASGRAPLLDRVENERAWQVPATELLAAGCNLDRKNPRANVDIEHLPPEELVDSIIAKEARIAELMAEIKAALGGRL